LVVGLGAQKSFDAARFQKICIESTRALGRLPVADAMSWLSEVDVPGRDSAWRVRTAALAADHAAYRYTATFKPRDKPAKPELATMTLAGATEAQAGLDQAIAIAAGVRFTRELANLPPNICNPAYIAEQAAAFAEGRLKPGAGMEEMKFDMGGAAGVLGAFVAAVEMKLPLNLVCVVPAVENMPDGDSYRPSDVLTSLSGLTIEVLNTDAEGRLILCDALTWTARTFEPHTIIDAATLTGACVVALGKHATGLMSKHDDLATELLNAGEQTLDRAWRGTRGARVWPPAGRLRCWHNG
jgi:leucyl aminopeptidase